MLTHPSFFKRPWWGVMALTFAAFVFTTTEFVPVGLLTAIGNSLGMRPTDVGVMMTVYAWTVALASVPLTLFVRKIDRRTLLMGVSAVFVLSHIVTGIAPNFGILVLGRIGIALAHAVFWSISIPLVVRLVPPEGERRAMAIVSIGTSVAMVAGVPMDRAIGDTLGWRATFQVIACAGVLAMAALWLTLPRLDSQGSGSLRSVPKLLKTPMLVVLFVVTVLIVCAHFSAYTYLEPFARVIAHATNNQVTYLLVLFGAAGLPAAFIFSRFYGRRPQRFLLSTISALGACLLMLWPCAQNVGTLSALLFAWGIAIICFGLAMQAHVLRLASDSQNLATSMFAGLYNIGIGAGALLGKLVARNVGLAWAGTFGVAVAAIGVAVCLLAFMSIRQTERGDVAETVIQQAQAIVSLLPSLRKRFKSRLSNAGSGQSWSGATSYNDGPFGFAAGYLHIDNGNATLSTRGTSTADSLFQTAGNSEYSSARSINIARASGSQALGAVTLGGSHGYAQYIPDASSTFKTAEKYNTGEVYALWHVSVPLTTQIGYTYTKSSGDSSAKYNNMFALGADYALSKRTDIYAVAGYQHASGKNGLGAGQAVMQSTNSGKSSQAVVITGLRTTF